METEALPRFHSSRLRYEPLVLVNEEGAAPIDHGRQNRQHLLDLQTAGLDDLVVGDVLAKEALISEFVGRLVANELDLAGIEDGAGQRGGGKILQTFFGVTEVDRQALELIAGVAYQAGEHMPPAEGCRVLGFRKTAHDRFHGPKSLEEKPQESSMLDIFFRGHFFPFSCFVSTCFLEEGGLVLRALVLQE